MTAFAEVLSELRAEFCQHELHGWQPQPQPAAAVTLAGVGTIAPTSLRSPVLRAAAADDGIEIVVGSAHGSLGDLVADGGWSMALVLSPAKRQALDYVEDLTPSAAASGVVDTIVRLGGTPPGGTPPGGPPHGCTLVGVNTNVYGAGGALARVVRPRRARTITVLGSGASARSVVIACRQWLPDAAINVVARSSTGAETLAAELGVAAGADGPASDVVVNTTSWGETEASEAQPMGIDPDSFLQPGVVLFDLNNRVGALKRLALERGCAVIPGTLMQRLVNGLRITLAQYVSANSH